jgi:hypothetical protein
VPVAVVVSMFMSRMRIEAPKFSPRQRAQYVGNNIRTRYPSVLVVLDGLK